MCLRMLLLMRYSVDMTAKSKPVLQTYFSTSTQKATWLTYVIKKVSGVGLGWVILLDCID